MRRFFISGIEIVTFLLTVAAAEGQTRLTQRGYPNVTDSYQSGLNLYYKTWADLNQAQKGVIANPGDWYRFEVARGHMDLLERTWQDGTFERSQINEAISDVESVLKFNSVSSGNREVLAQDLEQLRDIRLRYSR
jgi:hypothetical protein